MLLLDTHIWLWWLLGSANLPDKQRSALDHLADLGGLRVSAISLWEVQMLHAKGRLQLDRPFAEWIGRAAAPDVVGIIPLTVSVVQAINELPASFHGDPADRVIVATALATQLPLASQDKAIRTCGLVEIWGL